MSSYLTIYGVPKNEGKPIDIVSFSRSHCIYSAICDEVNVAWAGESEVYTNLNTSDLDGVIHSIEEDIKSSAERLTLYEKYAANNPDYIEEIILLKEYLEEAVEKVRYEEVDSEQIYEVIDELDPVDNNGSPTREIYNDKDELMWHNAELVNRGEIITQGIRSISENLSLIMEGEPESFRGGDIAFSTARRVMEMLGWKCSYAGKATLGQDAYYCIICTKPDKDFKYKIFGNAYEGSISKEKL